MCEAVQQHLTRFDINVKADDVVITGLQTGPVLRHDGGPYARRRGYSFLLRGRPTTAWFASQVLFPSTSPFAATTTTLTSMRRSPCLENTKAIILNTPNNPTGAVYTPEETQRLVDFAVKHDLWILDDMIYSTLVWTDVGYTSPCALKAGVSEPSPSVVGPKAGP